MCARATASRSCRWPTAGSAPTAGVGCSTCARRWPASGSATPWGGMAELATVAEYQVVRLPGRRDLPAGRADRADGGRRLRRRARRRRPGRPGADHRRRTDRRARGAVRARRRRRRRSTSRSRTRRAAPGPRRSASPPCSTRRRSTSRRTCASAATGSGVDVAIECSGHPRGLLGRPSRSLRRRGTLAQTGLFVGEAHGRADAVVAERPDDRRHVVLLGLRLRPHRGPDRRRRPAGRAGRHERASTLDDAPDAFARLASGTADEIKVLVDQ